MIRMTSKKVRLLGLACTAALLQSAPLRAADLAPDGVAETGPEPLEAVLQRQHVAGSDDGLGPRRCRGQVSSQLHGHALALAPSGQLARKLAEGGLAARKRERQAGRWS